MSWNDMPARWYKDYELGRPGYPPEAIDAVALPSSSEVLDLGAGTGKLTRLLLSRFASVVAVEPDDEMRRLLMDLCPQAEVLDGTAEQIPAAGDSFECCIRGAVLPLVRQRARARRDRPRLATGRHACLDVERASGSDRALHHRHRKIVGTVLA